MISQSNDQVSGRVFASEFRPAVWLRNRHAQTIYPSLPWSGAPTISTRREILELPDGDSTAVDWVQSQHKHDHASPTLVVLHGLEGSVESPYARLLLEKADLLGWSATVLHARDCGHHRNRLPRRYHAGETNDIRFFLETLRTRGHTGPLFAAGYSLGGNVLLKYLGESGQSSPLSAAAAISVPLNLHDSALALSSGFSKLYQYYLIKRMKTAMARKFTSQTSAFDWHRAMAATSFVEFDDAITAPLHGFAGKDEYYDQCSSIGFLSKIRCPTLIINSLDDPFMTPAAIPDSAVLSTAVHLELSKHGGHVGYISGGTPWKPQYYLPGRVLSFLAQHLSK